MPWQPPTKPLHCGGMFRIFFRKLLLILHCVPPHPPLSPVMSSSVLCAMYCEGRLAGLTAVVWTGVSHSTLHMLLTPAVITWFCGLYNADWLPPSSDLPLSVYKCFPSSLSITLMAFYFPSPSFSLFEHLIVFYCAPLLVCARACVFQRMSISCQGFHHSLFLVPSCPVLPECNDTAQEWFIPEQHLSGVS